MPDQPEAARLNLEYYRKQAKALLKAARSGDPAVLDRIARHSPQTKPEGRTVPALHDAQRTIAREEGFASWPRFRTFILQSALDFRGLKDAFIEAALSNGRAATAILNDHPELRRAGFHCALILGDAAHVQQYLAETPALAKGQGRPRNWEPLLYVCFSRLPGAHAETAQLLLAAGADPNASYLSTEWPDNPFSCLYGAAGLNNNPALARVLLDAGANPNDGESLYHSTEHPDLACFKLLLERGASLAGSNALKHMLDREDPDGVSLLLTAGADPNETNDRGETALHWAVWRGRSADCTGMLIRHGAHLDARRNDGRTAYAIAMQSGQEEIAEFLRSHGANVELSPLDRFLGDCSTAAPGELDRTLRESPEIAAAAGNERVLPDLAASHRTAAVRALLAAGVPVDARGLMGATALHWACWKGFADLVELLLEHGASLTIEDEEHHAPPPGWFDHGVRCYPEKTGDYPGVARLLLASGAAIPASDESTGNVEVDALLRRHGLMR